MKAFLVKRKTKGYSSPLSNFVRNASSAEKKRVYKMVMERATERQMRVIRSARKHHPELNRSDCFPVPGDGTDT